MHFIISQFLSKYYGLTQPGHGALTAPQSHALKTYPSLGFMRVNFFRIALLASRSGLALAVILN